MMRPNTYTYDNSQVKIENIYQYVSKIDKQNKNTKTKLKPKTQNT